jgi:hypothetical protein
MLDIWTLMPACFQRTAMEELFDVQPLCPGAEDYRVR